MNTIRAFFEKFGVDMLGLTYEHLFLTLMATAIAVVIAVPLGVYLTRTRWPRLPRVVLGIAGIVQTVPSLAMIAFIVLFFVFAGLSSIGVVPGLVALVLYALLPILRNTYTGIRQVDPAIVEVATGMGMTPRQILFQVELPLSLPVIMAGIRISTVWTIGVAMLCGLIGAGGLGELIFRGLRSLPRTADFLVAGTLPAACLALAADSLLGCLEKWLTPPGLRDETEPILEEEASE